MSNAIKLLLVSLFLVGCKGAYTKDGGYKSDKKTTYKAYSEVSKNATDHVGYVTDNVSNTATNY